MIIHLIIEDSHIRESYFMRRSLETSLCNPTSWMGATRRNRDGILFVGEGKYMNIDCLDWM